MQNALRSPEPVESPSSRRRAEPGALWVQATLCLVVAALLLAVAALPRPRPVSRIVAPARDPAFDLRRALGELRTAISQYQIDHGVWPGYTPQTLEHGCPQASAGWFERQLLVATDRSGEPARWGASEALTGPYLEGSLPVNPINGRATVRVLGEDEPWPEWPDGRAGWIYRPSNGEIRADSRGSVSPGGIQYDQL